MRRDMRKGPVKAAIVAVATVATVATVAAVAVFAAAWMPWPRPATVAAPRANPGRRFILVTSSVAAGPAATPANTVVVSAAGASGRIDQEVTALAGTSVAGTALAGTA